MGQLTLVREQLSESVILSSSEITKLREEIQIQYISASSQEKARRLAKEIHRLIDESLPDFSTEAKASIRMDLLKKKVIANDLTISAQEIIECSMELVPMEEFKKEMPVWLTQHVETSMELSAGYIEELFDPPSDHRQEKDPTVEQTKSLESRPYSIWWRHPGFLIMSAFILLSLVAIKNVDFSPEATTELPKSSVPQAEEIVRMANELPQQLQYQTIDTMKLQDWLNGRNSLLADEPYFSTIIKVADDFNINPLLLFAITGQEQGFVSRDHQKAKEIGNNPFNVFHSWEDFNTNILESSQIAARTIVNLSRERPEEEDPIQWINRKYAEDQNWWKGVSAIFLQLEEVAG